MNLVHQGGLPPHEAPVFRQVGGFIRSKANLAHPDLQRLAEKLGDVSIGVGVFSIQGWYLEGIGLRLAFKRTIIRFKLVAWGFEPLLVVKLPLNFQTTGHQTAN